MSTRAKDVINAIPGIETKRYLELGPCGGGTIRSVRAAHKIGVDVTQYTPDYAPDFLMTTDEFFAGPGQDMRFDVVFIDACHEARQVYRDFKNAMCVTVPGGIVLLHDLNPPLPEDASPSRCHDAFKVLLFFIWQADYDFEVLNEDLGLTAVLSTGLPKLELSDAQFEAFAAGLTYEHLESTRRDFRPVSFSELVRRVGQWTRSV